MKTFVCAILIALVSAAYANDYSDNHYCYNDISAKCKKPDKDNSPLTCNAKFGGIDHLVSEMQNFANAHIQRSFQYLLMSTHYGNYEKNRAGFEKLFHSLSDEKWNQAIDLIKYIAKRGGSMDFNKRKDFGEKSTNLEMDELESLSFALDIEKKLAKDTNDLHRAAVGKNHEHHDADIGHYLEDEFAEKQSGLIRKLAGYTTDLHSMLSSDDASLSLYLFDEYLQSQ